MAVSSTRCNPLPACAGSPVRHAEQSRSGCGWVIVEFPNGKSTVWGSLSKSMKRESRTNKQ